MYALILLVLVGQTDAILRASGVGYIGRGYDAVEANPDGVALGATPPPSASDPGIKTNGWLTLSYKEQRTDIEGRLVILLFFSPITFPLSQFLNYGRFCYLFQLIPLNYHRIQKNHILFSLFSLE